MKRTQRTKTIFIAVLSKNSDDMMRRLELIVGYAILLFAGHDRGLTRKPPEPVWRRIKWTD